MKSYMKTRIVSSMMLMALGIVVPFHTDINAGSPIYQASKKSVSADASANWAGYAATGTGFTSILGSWKVPIIKPSDTFGVDATWIGIGGVTSNDLIQGGTEAVVQHGTVQYLAWTEALPAASQPLTLQIHAGDSITAAVTQSSVGRWNIGITDTTTGQSSSKGFTYASSNSSAEWIEEAPSDASGILPLDNFNSIRFTDGSTMKNGVSLSITQAGAMPITLASDEGTILARTSATSMSGTSFSVTRTAAKAITTLHRIFGSMQTWTHKGHGIKKRSVHD
jgi:hypothetical protein